MATFTPAPMLTPGIAVVTGASSGIGRSCAVALSHAGWTVVVSGRRAEELEETARIAKDSALGEIKPVRCVPGDLAKPEDIAALFEVVEKEFGRLDLLFNNAGMNAPKANFEDVQLKDWNAIISINVTAPYLASQHAFRIMRDQLPQGGRIINNGSVSAYAPRPFSAPYTMSKHAILGLTKSTSLDGRAYNIAVSQLDIGNAESALGSAMKGGVLQADGQVRTEPVIPVEYVAATLVQMASYPLSVNILTQTLMATAMPFVGRG